MGVCCSGCSDIKDKNAISIAKTSELGSATSMKKAFEPEVIFFNSRVIETIRSQKKNDALRDQPMFSMFWDVSGFEC